MANLTAPIDPKVGLGMTKEYPVAASTKLFAGSFVVISAGYATKMVGGTANQKFVGICLETVDNTGANGAKLVKVDRRKTEIERVSSGLAQTDLEAPLYAADDNTVTLTAGTNTLVGYLSEFISATLCRMKVTPNC